MEDKRLSESECGMASPDLKLTHQEWIFFWKSRFEAATQRLILAQQWIDKVKEKMQSMAQEIAHLRKSNDELAAQLKNLQGQRQADAAKEGGAPEAAKIPLKKTFKRKKG